MNKLLLLIAVLWLTGCASSIQQRYISQVIESSPIHVELLKAGEEPKLYTSQDIGLDDLILQSRHYRQIGVLRFYGKADDVASVLALAKEVGATAVLLNQNHVDAKNISLPSVYHNGAASYYSDYLDKWSWAMIPNERISAKFFAKDIQKYRVGIGLNAISLDLKPPSVRRKGALIGVILEDSTAFSSNLRPGDILIKVNGEQVVDALHGIELLKKVDPLAKSLVLKVIRDGKVEIETLNLDTL